MVYQYTTVNEYLSVYINYMPVPTAAAAVELRRKQIYMSIQYVRRTIFCFSVLSI